MSASHEWFEWHLTPGGWVEGSYSLDFQGKTEIPVPSDRVLTVKNEQHMGHALGPMHDNWETTWRIADDALVRQLTTQFGERPAET